LAELFGAELKHIWSFFGAYFGAYLEQIWSRLGEDFLGQIWS